MSTGLLEQLNTYFDQVDASQTPVTEAEVKNRLGVVPVTSAKKPGGRRGLLVGVAVAAAVLAVGLLTLLTRGTAPETPVLSQPSPSPTVAAPAQVTGTWSRVPQDDAVFDQGWMSSVTAGGPGLVAVGSDESGTAVWTSVDGVSWSRITPDQAVFGVEADPDPVLWSVTLGGPGLVAVGSAEDHVAAVWTSPDGYSWSRVPHDDTTFVQGWMSSVTAGGPGLVAVGGLDPGAAVWTSVDGHTWTRVPHDEAVFGQGKMNSVTVGGPGLVAVGSDESGAAVWTSPDGTTWSRVPHDDAVFGTSDRVSMNSVTAGGPGLVAVGHDHETFGNHHVWAVWTSVDGFTWTRVSGHPETRDNLGDYSMASVISAGPGLVAVGASSLSAVGRGEIPTAAVWTSIDGISWSRIPYDEAAFGRGQMNVVTVAGPGLVAVGADRAGAAIWVSED